MFVRSIVGWKVSNRMNIDMMMAALNQAIADRNNPKDVIHRSDRGVQYLSIRYTDRSIYVVVLPKRRVSYLRLLAKKNAKSVRNSKIILNIVKALRVCQTIVY